jgi:hypothetical protein
MTVEYTVGVNGESVAAKGGQGASNTAYTPPEFSV